MTFVHYMFRPSLVTFWCLLLQTCRLKSRGQPPPPPPLQWRQYATVRYLGEKLWPWQYRPLRKSDRNKSVARIPCVPTEKALRRSPVEFCVQVNSTQFSVISRFLFVCDINWTLCKWSAVESFHSETRELINRVNTSVNNKQWRRVWLCLFAVQMKEQRIIVECRLRQWNRLDGTAETEITQILNFLQGPYVPPHNVSPHCQDQSFFPWETDKTYAVFSNALALPFEASLWTHGKASNIREADGNNCRHLVELQAL
jgi:hypothetical protein